MPCMGRQPEMDDGVRRSWIEKGIKKRVGRRSFPRLEKLCKEKVAFMNEWAILRLVWT